MSKNKHGGARPGAGRPKGVKKVQIYFRVPEPRAKEIRAKAKIYIDKLLEDACICEEPNLQYRFMGEPCGICGGEIPKSYQI